MQATATVIDFTLYRKRREARRNAELMWKMYAACNGLSAWTQLMVQQDVHFGKARP